MALLGHRAAACGAGNCWEGHTRLFSEQTASEAETLVAVLHCHWRHDEHSGTGRAHRSQHRAEYGKLDGKRGGARVG